jgi:hypothetical protein
MKRCALVLICAGFLALGCIAAEPGPAAAKLGISSAAQGGAAGAEGATIAAPQFKPDEIADFAKWEDFLTTAKIVDQKQLPLEEGVTQPWKLTLEKDGVTRNAVWKNVSGLVGGHKEGWKTEIAAYRLSKALGLNMVPPTVEREFRGDKGSCQLWVDSWKNFEGITKEKIQPKGIKYTYFIRELCLQRAFDNLIANEDRHQRNYLITEDWRMILIDHSRTFQTTGKFTKSLIYDEHFKEGKNFIMDTLPRKFYEAIKALTAASIREIVGDTLTDNEIAAMMARQALMIAWIENHIKEKGEAYVLYD